MKKHTEVLGSISPSVRGASRAADIVAALAPPPKPVGDTTAVVTQSVPAGPSAGRTAVAMVPGLAGGAAGAVVWKKHRVLGFLLGHAVGANALDVLHAGPKRTRALCSIGVEGAGVAGALYYKKHPVFGWVLGILAGSIATAALVPQSGAREAWEKVKSEWK